ncbi:MAG: type III pantothenate kinase [Nitrospinota bacterium]|nr:type III pantothenate kinase [Nitrospinota bacterium]
MKNTNHLMAIDVGNTQTQIGLFHEKELLENWSISSLVYRTTDELGILIQELFQSKKIEISSVKRIIISSVVPQLISILEEMTKKYFKTEPLFVKPGIKTGIIIKYENPTEVGADRIVNAVAGFHLYRGPLIIIDYGTATTFDAISDKGEYLGGAIAPGFGITLEALTERTAKLPRVEPKMPKNIIGKNTTSSIQAGMFFGYRGLVKEILEKMKKELGTETKVIATGGFSSIFSEEEKFYDEKNTNLTLIGLRLIADMN